MSVPTAVFGETVTRHSGRLYRAAVHLTKRTQDAEDLVQETYLRPATPGRPSRAQRASSEVISVNRRVRLREAFLIASGRWILQVFPVRTGL
jgi:hypothetical protein